MNWGLVSFLGWLGYGLADEVGVYRSGRYLRINVEGPGSWGACFPCPDDLIPGCTAVLR